MKRLYLILALFFSGSLSAQECACCDSLHSQFNFWAGEWEVFDTSGQLIGTNTISILQDSCVLMEEWQSSSGKSTGTSYNFYDADDGLWHQHWIDNKGGILNLSGSLIGNSMIMMSVSNTKGGLPTMDKIIWTPLENGQVRQVWKKSSNGGQTWFVVFEGLYKKKG